MGSTRRYSPYSTPDTELLGVISDSFSVNVQFSFEITVFLLSFMEFLHIKLVKLDPSLFPPLLSSIAVLHKIDIMKN